MIINTRRHLTTYKQVFSEAMGALYENNSKKARSVFVPEGLDERSDSTELAEVLAVYCLGTVRKSVPSR